MSSDLGDLYQEVILDHNRKPRNFGELAGANRRAEGYNPLCGDRITVFVDLEGDAVKDIRFQGSGCAISKASASMMTETMKGRTRAQAEALFLEFHRLLTEDGAVPDPKALGKLVVFSGVREFPVRVKCATLAWHTLRAALQNAPGVATTEGDDDERACQPVRPDPRSEAGHRSAREGGPGPADLLRPRDPGHHLRARAGLRRQ